MSVGEAPLWGEEGVTEEQTGRVRGRRRLQDLILSFVCVLLRFRLAAQLSVVNRGRQRTRHRSRATRRSLNHEG